MKLSYAKRSPTAAHKFDVFFLEPHHLRDWYGINDFRPYFQILHSVRGHWEAI